MHIVLREFPNAANCPSDAASGGTALHIAAAAGHGHAVVFLVEKVKLDVFARNARGQLAVSVAKTYGIAL